MRKEDENRSIQWFNILTGEFSEIHAISAKGKFISPWQGKADAILISRTR